MKKKLSISILTIALSLLLFSSCKTKSKEKVQSTEKTEQVVKYTNCDDAHWEHKAGENGPENWKNLCDGFSDCGGEIQSPINIVTNEVSSNNKLSAFEFNYGSNTVDIINNGHTVQFNISGNNTMIIKDKEYTLLQFHYHAKSEHTINGNYSPIEVHFVHKHSDTDYAVIGVLFEEGEAYELFSNYLADMPKTKGTFISENKIELASLLPNNLSYYNYNGSLTTPPCTEIVNWYILQEPLQASKEQINKFSTILHNNYRPTLPLNDREVKSFNE